MGGASSLLFAAEGAKVGVVDRNEEAGRDVVDQIRAAGGTAVFAKADVSKADEVDAAVKSVTAELGAGQGAPAGPWWAVPGTEGAARKCD